MSGEPYYCSFCGKSQHETIVLVAGPACFICDDCTDMCTVIVADARAKRRFQLRNITDVEPLPSPPSHSEEDAI
jgi:ATP-dependent protease Clp ATPase subunit